MTNEEKKKAFGMLVDGATYQEVADELGVSKQYVHHEFGSYFNRNFNRKCTEAEKYKYIGIRDFLVENNLNATKFAKAVGTNSGYMIKILQGVNNPSKKMIDKILKFTGLSYEEAFREE